MSGKTGNKTIQKGEAPGTDKNRFNMKIVTSDVCERCKQQCARGIRYMERMETPGAVGTGVPCFLTKGKAYK